MLATKFLALLLTLGAPTLGALTATPQTLTDTATSQLQVVASDADAGPSPLSYAWSIVSGGGSLSSSTATNPVYTPANVSAPTSAVIKVTVSDGAVSVNQSLTLTVNDTPVRTETVTYYHNDALGSPVAATDQSGTLLWRETYRPYGERLNNQAASGNNPLWYTGKRQDAETGLVYMGSRYYDPRLGRFISIDPVEPDENNLHSLNRYAYANNNPYKFTDPDGQNPFLVLIAFGMEMINLANSDGPPGGGLTKAGANTAGKLATKGEEVTQTVKQAVDRGAARAGEKAAEKTYQTYTKTNVKTGEVYCGRTSGCGTPLENIAKRDSGHHMNDKNFGPAKLDKSSTNKNAIRGREQQVIDVNGGAKSVGGTSGNSINGISPRNPNAQKYFDASRREFGG